MPLLFQNRGALKLDDLKRYARDLNLDATAFGACLESRRPGMAVIANEEAGNKYGVKGTPAIFINGIKLIGLLPLPVIEEIIAQELARMR